VHRYIRLILLTVVSGLAAAAAAILWTNKPVPRATDAMTQEAYVWQRSWTPAVNDAVAGSDPALSGLVALAAEISWVKGRPRVVEVSAAEPLRAALGRKGGAAAPIRAGLALRVGPYAGSFDESSDTTRLVTGMAAKVIEDARAAGLRPDEFQVDFDCTESHLGDYARWLRAIRAEAAGTPVVFTALPSWLGNRRFAELAAAADGFVLQVHSLERPASADTPIMLCDPATARRAVERAARFGRPFRVALPTYGYLVAFDRKGVFAGLSAEGPTPAWPADAYLRTVRTDPAVMADLVRGWQTDRPAMLRGILWYRLPTEDDKMNWSPTTFSMVISGQTPHSLLRAQTRRPSPGLVEVELTNDGQASAPLTSPVEVRWRSGRLVAADAVGGYERQDAPEGRVRFAPSGSVLLEELRPAERRLVGWLRLSEEGEVQADVVPENQKP
jgi:hypothetical protein